MAIASRATHGFAIPFAGFCCVDGRVTGVIGGSRVNYDKSLLTIATQTADFRCEQYCDTGISPRGAATLSGKSSVNVGLH